LCFFFRKTPLSLFDQQCREFADQVIPALLRPKAMTEISQLQQQGIPVVIVSASPENWIRPWAASMQLELIATRLQITGNELTGKIEGRNCYGKEKVRRIEQLYSLSDFTDTYAYGDSSGDRPMLAVAKIAFYKPFL
jgi:HAD superfamily hydrolase (TIGR01490 family)